MTLNDVINNWPSLKVPLGYDRSTYNRALDLIYLELDNQEEDLIHFDIYHEINHAKMLSYSWAGSFIYSLHYLYCYKVMDIIHDPKRLDNDYDIDFLKDVRECIKAFTENIAVPVEPPANISGLTGFMRESNPSESRKDTLLRHFYEDKNSLDRLHFDWIMKAAACNHSKTNDDQKLFDLCHLPQFIALSLHMENLPEELTHIYNIIQEYAQNSDNYSTSLMGSLIHPIKSVPNRVFIDDIRLDSKQFKWALNTYLHASPEKLYRASLEILNDLSIKQIDNWDIEKIAKFIIEDCFQCNYNQWRENSISSVYRIELSKWWHLCILKATPIVDLTLLEYKLWLDPPLDLSWAIAHTLNYQANLLYIIKDGDKFHTRSQLTLPYLPDSKFKLETIKLTDTIITNNLYHWSLGFQIENFVNECPIKEVKAPNCKRCELEWKCKRVLDLNNI